jgi:hypothetical protein
MAVDSDDTTDSDSDLTGVVLKDTTTGVPWEIIRHDTESGVITLESKQSGDRRTETIADMDDFLAGGEVYFPDYQDHNRFRRLTQREPG